MAQFEAQGVYHVENLPIEAVGDLGHERVVKKGVLTHVLTEKFIFERSLDLEKEL